MLVTCITITRASRMGMLADSIRDFLRQTQPDREQLIVHDGDHEDHTALQAQVNEMLAEHKTAAASVRLHQAPPGIPLGALRNIAVDLSQGDIICQWDDDDRYHPQRLALQLAAMQAQGAAFCFLSDQLHAYVDTSLMTWDDWNTEAYPLNFVQGTLMGRRACMPSYPALSRGEDTGLCLSLLEAGHAIARLRGAGWCYVYTYHGHNAWSRQHHWAISQAKQLPEFKLRARLYALRQRLAEYGTSWQGWTLGHRSGSLPLTHP